MKAPSAILFASLFSPFHFFLLALNRRWQLHNKSLALNLSCSKKRKKNAWRTRKSIRSSSTALEWARVSSLQVSKIESIVSSLSCVTGRCGSVKLCLRSCCVLDHGWCASSTNTSSVQLYATFILSADCPKHHNTSPLLCAVNGRVYSQQAEVWWHLHCKVIAASNREVTSSGS